MDIASHRAMMDASVARRFELSLMTKSDPKPSLHWLEDEPMSFDRRYWTTHCEGFRVEFPGGAKGYVDEVRHPDDPDRAAALVVRMGALGQRVAIVPVEEIEFILPRAERILLRSPVTLERTERA